MGLRAGHIVVFLSCLFPFYAAAVCGDPYTPIHEIQGRGSESTMVGQKLAVEGVVSFARTAPDEMNGFFLQSLEPDGDPRTSEGIFVYSRGNQRARDVLPGQWLRLAGTVKEYHGMTELVNPSSVQLCGKVARPSPKPASSQAIDWESVEGMLVSLPGEAEIMNSYFLGSKGQLQVRWLGRAVLLDDGRFQSGLSSRFYTDSPGSMRLGDHLSGLRGVVDEYRGSYRLQVERVREHIRSNPRPAPPAKTGDEARIASFNVENLFNGTVVARGQRKFSGSRGARTQDQFQRQLKKLSLAIDTLDAGLVLLQELENDYYIDETGSALGQLVASLRELSGKNWQFIEVPEGMRSLWPAKNKITQGFIFDETVWQPVGELRWPPAGSYSRPHLAQGFRHIPSGIGILAINVHLKSKGGCKHAGPGQQDEGFGCYNGLRVKQVQELSGWIARLVEERQVKERPAQERLANVLLAGDFNAAPGEPPFREIPDNLVSLIQQGYSKEYKGRKQLLDHIFAGQALLGQVARAGVWHINADEPVINSHRTLEAGDESFYRSSDHDPVYVDLKLKEAKH